ncbi:alkaline phosphatase family protein [Paraglaciecola polaris]|uniref:Phosphoglyceromutase n=1 Tax=Paraglaciecola polaris LMG 21857 TaxID=1129793 RepID=K6ZC89_9ALTE|nr:alkaline phosphatase family protein [Paraglaciecola polaris]GAC33716.1 hypothetical protein GPLA_2822 [Paraglaciecola polaris LMG 21857]
MQQKKSILVLFYTLLVLLISRPNHAADNLLIISIDGLRWQEVFRGYEASLLAKPEFKHDAQLIADKFGGESLHDKRQKLMPFLWKVIAKQGVLLGNRDKQSAMQVSNNWWFSYPGYNEILTGKGDEDIDSNKPLPNPNVTILEWLNKQNGYQDQVAVFGSWAVFPAIINQERSKLPINAGFMPAAWDNLSANTKWLNSLQEDIPSPWHNVRLDAFTVGFAQDYILAKRPKVIYVALGETDDFAHDGDYPAYLSSAHRSDAFIKRLWQTLQSLAQYKGNTNLLITVDHGRGEHNDTWQHHASPKATQGYLNDLATHKQGIAGSNQVWMAAIGPDAKPMGELRASETFSLNQIAATALELLEKDPGDYAKINGAPIGQALPIVNGQSQTNSE